MKKLYRILSYILVAAIASAATFGVILYGGLLDSGAYTKLEELSDLIQQKFIGDADVTAMEDAAADAIDRKSVV